MVISTAIIVTLWSGVGVGDGVAEEVGDVEGLSCGEEDASGVIEEAGSPDGEGPVEFVGVGVIVDTGVVVDTGEFCGALVSGSGLEDSPVMA